VTEDRLLDHVLETAKSGDLFLTSFHRGHLNESRDSRIKLSRTIEMSQKATIFLKNMEFYLPLFQDKGMPVYLIKDGPLLSDADTTLEGCLLEFTQHGGRACPIDIRQDVHTRYLQSLVFDKLAEEFENVHAIVYLPVLYRNDVFSPISEEGGYLMFDRHNLTERASLLLTSFLDDALAR
jgi:hypothetical protein